MIRQDIQDLKSGPRELRKFGWLVGGVFCALGVLFWSRGRAHFPCLIPGVLLVFFGTVWPRVLKPIYLGWMVLAILLGFIVSHVLLALFFFGVITPIGLLARLVGKDFLRLRRDPNARTYWLPRKPDRISKESYEKQF